MQHMQNICIVLEIVHSRKGEIVIMDCPPGFTPSVGMVLVDESGNKWNLTGIGMPATLSMLANKIDTYYNSERVWDCLLTPVVQQVVLEKGSRLFFDHS